LKEILDKKQMYDDRQDIWAGNGILFPTWVKQNGELWIKENRFSMVGFEELFKQMYMQEVSGVVLWF
jgi:hypothetical protein